jgi:hypothetical protein
MTIQHRDIPNAQLHEPKNVNSALANTVYKANGTGSGTWTKVGSSSLQGVTGDGGIPDKFVLSDGLGGFKLGTAAAHGALTITNNLVNFPLIAVADTTFNTTSQYSLMTGTGSPWAAENVFGVIPSVDRLTVPVAGVYLIYFWANITSFPSSTAKVSVRYRVNGGAFSTRKPMVKSAIAADMGQLVSIEMATLAANDYIQIYVASDATGNLLIGDAVSSIDMIRQLV